MLSMVYHITDCNKKFYDKNKYNHSLKTEGYKRRQRLYSQPVLLCLQCADDIKSIIQ